MERWFSSTDDDSLFSFESICTTLRIDPDCLRAGLLRLKRGVLLEGRKVPALRVRRRAGQNPRRWRGRIGSGDRPVAAQARRANG